MKIKKIPRYNFKISNADTDSIAFCKQDQSPISEEEQKRLLDEINGLMDDGIVFAHDGYFDTMVVFKTKNYIMYNSKAEPKKQIKTKGSAYKAPTIELALKEFLSYMIEVILKETNYKELILTRYNELVQEVIKDDININRWVFRKALTGKSLDTETDHTTALKIQKALAQDSESITGYQVMDRVYFYFDVNGDLRLDKFYNKDHNKLKLLEKIYNTACRCEDVLGDIFVNYSLKRNYTKLINGEPRE